MMKDKNIMPDYYGDEAGGWKQFLIVVLIVAFLIGISWVSYYKLGWFH